MKFDRKAVFGSLLLTWAASLQVHMMWLQRQPSFKEKFGKQDGNKEHPHMDEKLKDVSSDGFDISGTFTGDQVRAD
ncbi:hypothetical protein O6H91_08G112300 [Diphasiastrum complanatum]|uniref:Uncharacterized protein n=3 Tax=Diphasiastrum complanatum TaxID=34168 RepID=A0ACC2D0R1_DIPCM|nr:hypothetical protein O6H91_08G105900 [Diphasiastrum complanatum]KAJ7547836.1 hypothetical protein O6H91_08G106100 [Diphasiastrum complanatum]KAJ7547983.1 hypothetical protein O6H91_08G112300 [Diphasiastrum complanatum]